MEQQLATVSSITIKEDAIHTATGTPDRDGDTHHSHHTLGPSDIASGPLEVPKQPILAFPFRIFGRNNKRSFNSTWYKKYSWLEYSVEYDAAFCYPCTIFKSASEASRAENAFMIVGFRNWKNALGKKGVITSHSSCESHKQAMISWKDYIKNTERHTTVLHRLDSSLTEVRLAKASLHGKEMEDVSDVLLELEPLKVAFPELMKLLQIALTISVSTAKCERSFSALKRIKSYLRSSMSEQRLNDMAILSIERDLTKEIEKEDIITQFSQTYRRISL